MIKDGIRIRYVRTNGATGNVSARTLCKLITPSIWTSAKNANIAALTADSFSVINNSAATNGANPETIDEAYNGFKKTIGTFDTLVTCRDYMNKIYQLTMSETDTTPLVSNVIVSDVRDDINSAVTLCTFSDYGICYKDLPIKNNNESKLEYFDLCLYPFKTVYGVGGASEYANSFKIDKGNNNRILHDLDGSKTIAHRFVDPDQDDIACIKNYLRLKAKITTAKRVTAAEEAEILSNVYAAIYRDFNCRKIDFGEEIPYDSILNTLRSADTRIKDVLLDEPVLYTKIMTADNQEYALVSSDEGMAGVSDGAELYNRLALRNVLAGRIAAFAYDNSFPANYDEKPVANGLYEKVTKMVSHFDIGEEAEPTAYKLGPNEVIQFRSPNLKTAFTYPAYVNYYVKLNRSISGDYDKAVPATFESLADLLSNTLNDNNWQTFVAEHKTLLDNEGISLLINDGHEFSTQKQKYCALFEKTVTEEITTYSVYN